MTSSRDASQYGRYFWCIKSHLSKDGEIYAHADEMSVREDGTLVLTSIKGDERHIRLAIARGQWTAAFAASCIDGHAIAVEHWAGEVAT